MPTLPNFDVHHHEKRWPVRVLTDVLSGISPTVSKAKIQTVAHGFQEFIGQPTAFF